jgi:Zn finger protein HypA/HybF involved in hydrogenase expression
MSYCHIHGQYDNGNFGCPECREAQGRAEADRAATLFQLEQQAWEAKNPGSHECPHCRYISLKKAATRCPLCHGVIDDKHWQEVAAREHERERAAKEARRRQAKKERVLFESTRPERERAERERAEALQRSAQFDAEVMRWKKFRRSCGCAYSVFFLFFLPLCVIITATLSDKNPDPNNLFFILLFCVPVINWIFLLELFMGIVHIQAANLWSSLFVWVVLGLVGIPLFKASLLFGAGATHRKEPAA